MTTKILSIPTRLRLRFMYNNAAFFKKTNEERVIVVQNSRMMNGSIVVVICSFSSLRLSALPSGPFGSQPLLPASS